jgi:hypothetical protein
MATTVPIESARYNALRDKVNKVLGISTTSAPTFGYGQPIFTSSVTGNYEANLSTTDKVTAEQYKNLYIDLIRIRAHQIGAAAITINPFVEGDFLNNSENADKIELAYIQSLESLATNIETDRFLIDANTQADIVNLEDASGNQIRSVRRNIFSGTWNGTISHIFQVEFADAAARRHFFNAGGQIRFNASVDYSGSQAKTIDWQTQLSAMGSILFKADRSESALGVGSGSLVGNNNLSSTYQVCYRKSGGALYINNDYVISARASSDRIIQFKIDFRDLGPNNATFGIDESVEGDFISSAQLLRPNGTVTINGEIFDTVEIKTPPTGLTLAQLGNVAAPTYTLSTSSSSVNEGSSFTITLTTTGVSTGTLIPYTVTGISSSDLSSGSLTGNFTVNSVGAATASFAIRSDSETEGTEVFRLALNNGQASVSVIINDTSTAPPPPPPPGVSYSLTTTTSSINEGGSVTFTAIANNLGSGTLYWTVESVFGTINSNDFSTPLSGSVLILNDSGTITITTRADSTTEGAEQFRLRLRTGSTSGTIVATSSIITINDTSTTPPAATPSLSLSSTSSSSTWYGNIPEPGANPTITLTAQNGSVTINSIGFSTGAGALQLPSSLPFTIPNGQSVNVGIYGQLDGSNRITFGTSAGNYTYTQNVSRLSGPSTISARFQQSGTTVSQISSGSLVEFEITVSSAHPTRNLTYRIPYISSNLTNIASTGNLDLTVPAGQTRASAVFPVNVINSNNNGSITSQMPSLVRPINQPIPDAGGVVRSGGNPSLTVNASVAAPTYSVTHSSPTGSSTVSEGQSSTFTVTTTGVANGTTLFWTTEAAGVNAANLNAADFTDGVLSGSFTINNNSGTIVRGIAADSTTEGSEVFRLQIRTGSIFGTVVASSPFVGIADTSTTPPAVQLNGSLTVTSNYVAIGGFQTKQYYVTVRGDTSAGSGQNWSISTSLTADIALRGTSGTFDGVSGSASNVALITFQAPHTAQNVTLTLSKSGYITQTIQVAVPFNSVYSPYNYSRGFPQEFSSSSSLVRSYAQTIAQTYYESISTPFTTSSIGGRTTWYGAGRRGDVDGIIYWGQLCVTNGIPPTSLSFRNTIFTTVNSLGPGNADYDACIRSSKSFRFGTGYNTFFDRP